MDKAEVLRISELIKEISDKRAVLESRTFSFDDSKTLMAAEISLLKTLSGHPGESVTYIAGLMNLTKGAVSQTLRKLELKGLVEKLQDPGNASRVSIVLSFKGRVVIQKLRERDNRLDHALESQIISLKKKELNIIKEFLLNYDDSLGRRI